MSKKKLLWIGLLLLFIGMIVFLVVLINSRKNDDNGLKSLNTFSNNTNTVVEDSNSQSKREYEKKELSDGILYSIDGKEYEVDITVGDNYFDTTITDMYTNPEDYYNQNIQIEGMYLTDGQYTSVGRYSTSSLCAFCPAGYSFIEFQLDGNLDREFTAEEDWLKIIGKLEKGNDSSSFYQDYYYIKVLSLEVMNEKGQATVNN